MACPGFLLVGWGGSVILDWQGDTILNPWPAIPDDVVAWFRTVFTEANRRVCERLVNLPNIRETSLDDGLIEALIPDSAPTLLPSGAIVRMDTHNIGGLRRLGAPDLDWDFPQRRRWETADIAILVFVYRRDVLIARRSVSCNPNACSRRTGMLMMRMRSVFSTA